MNVPNLRRTTLRRAILGCLLATVLAGCPGPSSDIALADRWLRTDCTYLQQDSITARLRLTNARLETYFIRAFDSGAPAALLQIVDSAARRDFARVATVDTTDVIAFAGAGEYLATPVDSLAARYRISFDRAYRSRALIALGVIATPNAVAKLTAVAGDSSSRYFREATAIRAEVLSAGFFSIK
jgi:hypothetical protein